MDSLIWDFLKRVVEFLKSDVLLLLYSIRCMRMHVPTVIACICADRHCLTTRRLRQSHSRTRSRWMFVRRVFDSLVPVHRRMRTVRVLTPWITANRTG